MIIKAFNPDVVNNFKTSLTVKVVATDTALTIANNTGFTQNDFFILGKMGEERTELQKVNAAVSGKTALTSTALNFDHGVDTTLCYVKYDKVRFYRSTDSGVTYTLLTTVDMQTDRVLTSYDDSSGLATHYYKACYYNSISTAESAKSSALVGTGYTTYSLKYLQDRVLALFPDPQEEFLVRDEITDWFNEYYLDLAKMAISLDQGYFAKDNTDVPGSLVNGTLKYALPTDFASLKRMEISYDGSTYFLAYPSHIRFGQPSQPYDKTNPLYDFEGVNFRLRPTPDSSNGKYKLWYYYLPPELSADTDELDIFLRPYKPGVIAHALAESKRKQGKHDEATYWENKATRIMEKAKEDLSMRQRDMGTWVDITDTAWVDTDDTWLFWL